MEETFPWRTGRSCLYKNYVHLIFVTKYRRGVFTKCLLKELEVLFKETCTLMECELIEFNGEDDHVHLLVNVHPKLAIANLVGKLKGLSAYKLNKMHSEYIKKFLWGKHFWSPSYCAVSCGGASLDTIKQYIENQRKPPDKKKILKSKMFSHKPRGKASPLQTDGL